MVAQQGQMIFKKVAVSERKNLFKRICEEKVQVAIKGADSEEICHLIAVQSERDEVLLCHHTADSKNITGPQKVLANFAFEAERYFFQTELVIESGWVILRTDVDLFQLQRRANARIDIPSGYKAHFNMLSHQEKTVFVECTILDISAGGLKLSFEGGDPEIKMGDVLKGSLHLSYRRPIDFQVEVRYVLNQAGERGPQQIFGVQFMGVSTLLENRLLSLMMDLQRELFLKYPVS